MDTTTLHSTTLYLIRERSLAERVLMRARLNAEAALAPQQAALSRTQAALRKNQQEIDTLLATATAGQATGALMDLPNHKAQQLKIEREALLVEQRQLSLVLTPLDNAYDPGAYQKHLANFQAVAQAAQPKELQRLLRLAVREVKWGADGNHRVLLYDLPKTQIKNPRCKQTGYFNEGV